nr:hypothetical protein [Jeotgalibacillus malaysiensis]
MQKVRLLLIGLSLLTFSLVLVSGEITEAILAAGQINTNGVLNFITFLPIIIVFALGSTLFFHQIILIKIKLT